MYRLHRTNDIDLAHSVYVTNECAGDLMTTWGNRGQSNDAVDVAALVASFILAMNEILHGRMI